MDTKKNLAIIAGLVALILTLTAFRDFNKFQQSIPVKFKTTSEEVPMIKTLEIKDSVYNPATLTVKPGEKIKVINRDLVGHSVTSVNKALFDTGILIQNQEKEIIAPDKKGSYPFRCTPHPSIKGNLIVE